MKPLAVVFSGAGLSADSGVPTFRDSNGLWENHKVEDVAEHEAWFRDKQLVLKFYEERFNKYKDCKPHAGHYALAKLEEKYRVVHITQNIDSLLEQAGCTCVEHLHGTITTKKCEWHSEITDDTRFVCNYKAEASEPVKLGELCPTCNGQLRPDIVWFNEAVKFDHAAIMELAKDVKYNDGVFICVGTSIQVFPAGYLVPFFAQVKNKFIVDRNPHKVSDYELIKGNAVDELPMLVSRLLNSAKEVEALPEWHKNANYMKGASFFPGAVVHFDPENKHVVHPSHIGGVEPSEEDEVLNTFAENLAKGMTEYLSSTHGQFAAVDLRTGEIIDSDDSLDALKNKLPKDSLNYISIFQGTK